MTSEGTTRGEFSLWDLDETLIEEVVREGTPRWAVRRPEGVCVVLGRGSSCELEVHQEKCARENIPILRRRGGGCSVVLDSGQLILSLVLPAAGIGDNDRWFRMISDLVIAALAECGIDGVRQLGISDLARDDRKIGGSCIYRRKGILYYSTTILVDPDLERIARLLKHPPREPEWRRKRAHTEFMGVVREIVPDGIDGLKTRLETSLARLVRAHGMP
jgi:lipoate-protein ligase A